VAAVAHNEFAALSMADIAQKLVPGGAFMDVKAAFNRESIQAAGFNLWRL
jgi:UDP-N-acetyl-D-galactosamine dehydrogenase